MLLVLGIGMGALSFSRRLSCLLSILQHGCLLSSCVVLHCEVGPRSWYGGVLSMLVLTVVGWAVVVVLGQLGVVLPPAELRAVGWQGGPLFWAS